MPSNKLNALIAHSGGPTSVLNCSLLGVVEEAERRGIGRLWAGRWGLAGVLAGDVIDLLRISRRRLVCSAEESGSVLGSFRGPITEVDLDRLIGFFRQREIRYFFYTGGNGSMGTALRVARAATARGYELVTIGIPKTIDNDICETDHCPGFGSGARFVATAVREIGIDQRALPSPVSIMEVMGRNVGWLAAASLLARQRADDPPHFIYVPELVFDREEFLGRVDRLLSKLGWVVGVVAEGLRDASGHMLGAAGASNRDAKGRPLMGNTSVYLAVLVSRRLKVRPRSEKPGVLCRAFSPCRSAVDAQEAYGAGRFAVRAACKGITGVMVALQRAPSGSYRNTFSLVSFSRVADRERKLPGYYLRGAADIHDRYRAYVRPLVGPGLEPITSL